MRIRAVTFCVSLLPADFEGSGLEAKFTAAQVALCKVRDVLSDVGYEVQTLRISLNSFEDWVNTDKRNLGDMLALVDVLVAQLEAKNISFCSLGGCKSDWAIALLPDLLHRSDRLNCSVRFDRQMEEEQQGGIFAASVSPKRELCLRAAEASLRLFDLCGDMGNFRFCASFQCQHATPFFPTSFHQTASPACISIGLESGDLLFLGFHGVDSAEEGRQNLFETMRQALGPIQTLVLQACLELTQSGPIEVQYAGIDASINPGLTLPDSVASGLENLLFPRPVALSVPSASSASSSRQHVFGSFGTLAAVSAVTGAIKALQTHGGIKLVGYNGLMLPVMEDIILAERASQEPPLFSLRDLLVFSSVCGVGLDTIPIPGDTNAEQLADVYVETGALAFRLDKPLSVRLLPMLGRVAGDQSTLPPNPYLTNTRVFAV